jgi:uncharacterized membrane protein
VSPTARTEAFSDGVFAVAATLLVLNIDIPPHADGRLLAALVAQWPAYAAYAVSFLTIGIIWVNHHAIFERIQRVDRRLQFINLLLLTSIALIPFGTRLVSDRLQAGRDDRVAAAVLGVVFIAMSVAFGASWIYAVLSSGMLRPEIDAGRARSSLWRFMLGLPVYGIGVALSLVSARLGVIVYGVIALFYMFDSLPPLVEVEAGLTES